MSSAPSRNTCHSRNGYDPKMVDSRSKNDRPTSLQYQTAVSRLPWTDQLLPSVSINPPATNNVLKSLDDYHNKPLSKPSTTSSDRHTLTPTTTSLTSKKFSTESDDSGCQSSASSVTSLRSHCNSKETSGSNLNQSCQIRILEESPVTEDTPKAPQLITERANNGDKKVIVNETAFSNLLKAALILQEGAVLLATSETDGPYFRRRSTGEGGSKVKESRRVSSQAYFHSMDTIEQSPNNQSRRTSGCIVCDRKRKLTTKGTPPPSTKVIIKTSMSRKAQQTRRFSEAMQVMRNSQSNLPYVELYVLNREELMKLRKDHEPILKLVPFDEPREKVLKRCVFAKLPDFVRYTNWSSITPYLVAKKLLTIDDRQKLMNVPTHTEKGNCFYLDMLPTKGDDAYCRLYECIKDEPGHSGHDDLIKILDSAFQ